MSASPSKVPLQFAEITVLFGESAPVELDEATKFRESLRKYFDEALPLSPSANLHFQTITLGGGDPAAPLVLINTSHGALFSLFNDGFTIRWTIYDAGPYPGYDVLSKAAEVAASVTPRSAAVVKISYRVLQPKGEFGIAQILNERWMTPVARDSFIHESVVNYRLESGADYRISVINTDNGVIVGSDGGLRAEGRTAIESLELLHQSMIAEFGKLVTKEALREWGLDR